MRSFALVLVLAACGDNTEPRGTLEIVGHADLGARGMNSALALAGDTAYVGSRNDRRGIAIVDISDPADPRLVGEIGPPDEGVTGLSSRELRAVPELDLLLVLNLRCSLDLHGCSQGQAELENLRVFDIHDRRAPRPISTYFFTPSSMFTSRSPHELFVWRDPVDPQRVLALVSVPGAPTQLEIFDVTNGDPIQLFAWDPIRDGKIAREGTQNSLHSVSTSDDGRTAYLSHQQGGLIVVDMTSLIELDQPTLKIDMITPPEQVLDWSPPESMGPHSAVAVPQRDLLVVTDEVYPMPYSTGCPWGHLRTVDISDPSHPAIAGEFRLPENDPALCATLPTATAYTAHNATVTHDLALVSWYAGGLQALDISDAAHPLQLAELRPTPLAHVDVEDPVLGGAPVEMWSYPIIRDGLIYVVDVRNGLYVVRYRGLRSEQVRERRFLEGNSNLGAYLPRH